MLTETLAEEDKTARKGEGKEPQDQVGGRPEQQRDRLRDQAAEQLERLQTMEQENRIQRSEAVPQKPSELPELTAGSVLAVEKQTPQEGQAAPGAPVDAAQAGYLSLDLDLAPVGTAYHFRKLHGEPRLVLRARHEDLDRVLTAVVWAGLCLVFAATVIRGLRRPNAAELAPRGWPWLAAVAGTAWLFLLPAGVLGLALVVTALWVLIARSRNHRTTDFRTPEIQH